MTKVIQLTERGRFKDGGSISYIGSDGNKYWRDYKIKSKREGNQGKLYIGDINNKTPKLTKGLFTIVGEVISQ